MFAETFKLNYEFIKDLKGKGNLFSNTGGLLLRRGIVRPILWNSEVELRPTGGSDNLVQKLVAWYKEDFNRNFCSDRLGCPIRQCDLSSEVFK